MKKVAILVDGGFYRKIAKHLWGDKSPEQRCEELIKYCRFHLKERDNFITDGDKRIYQYNELYRIFIMTANLLIKKFFIHFCRKPLTYQSSRLTNGQKIFLSN